MWIVVMAAAVVAAILYASVCAIYFYVLWRLLALAAEGTGALVTAAASTFRAMIAEARDDGPARTEVIPAASPEGSGAEIAPARPARDAGGANETC